MTPHRSRGRTALLLAITVLISLGLAVAGSEAVLRIVYRDAGRTTLGGPGGRDFVYTYLPNLPPSELRGPMDTGPKVPGVRRLMVLGDSITWGQGVTAWTDTYPVRLLESLNANGRRYDMAVYAYPGKEIDNHLATIARAIPELRPDLVVYQWYSNDLEISKAGRPPSRRAWRGWSGHATLRSWSYLYFVLDFALDAYLPPSGRTYLQYLEEDFADGTPAWRTFTRTFHSWAAYATGYADRTIVMLYPAVPMTALVDLRQRMATLAAGQVLTFEPGEMTHPTGTLTVTPGLRLAHGAYVAAVQLRLDAPAQGDVVRLRITHGSGAAELAAITVNAAELGVSGEWHTQTLPFRIDEPMASDVTLQVESLAHGGVSVGRMDLPVRYGIEVLDLAPHLADMKTAASLFDAHPGALAHAVMADVLARAIQTPPPSTTAPPPARPRPRT